MFNKDDDPNLPVALKIPNGDIYFSQRENITLVNSFCPVVDLLSAIFLGQKSSGLVGIPTGESNSNFFIYSGYFSVYTALI